jgi:hypothetical protein
MFLESLFSISIPHWTPLYTQRSALSKNDELVTGSSKKLDNLLIRRYI